MAIWKLKGSGNWNSATNWSSATVPTSGDVVLDFSQLGTFASPYTVTILATDPAYAIDNLTMTTPNFSRNVGLDLFGTLSVAGTFTASGFASLVNEFGGTFLGNNGNFGNASSLLIWSLRGSSTATFTGLISGSGVSFSFGDNTADRLVFGEQLGSFAGSISRFRANNIIDLTKVAYGAGGFSATQTSAGQSLAIVQGGITVMTFAHFSFQGATASSLTFAPDGAGGTILMVCFAAGTRIATEDGEVAVEDLREGDRVVTLQGGALLPLAVRWVGRRQLDLRGHPNAWAVAPVRIRAGAFADQVPHRDLLVSPDHAVFVDTECGGGLIPARRLINHVTIVQETGLPSVRYFHVELERHAILLAEGLPAESYLDTGNRGFFGNADAPLILHPDLIGDEQARSKAKPCVKFLIDEASVRPVWQRLRDRAVASGVTVESAATTDDPDLLVVAGGREIRPVSVQAGRYVFALPGGIGSARLVSRTAAPADASPWLDDRRKLGVALERIQFRSADGVKDIPMDHPALSQGWWDVERTGTRLQRWTSGEAVIPLPVGPVLLELTVVGTASYQLPLADAADLRAA